MNSKGDRGLILEQASAHFARARSPEWDAADAVALKVWLSKDEAHARAFNEVAALWSGLDAVGAQPAMLLIREEVRTRARRRSFMRVATNIAASVAAVVLLAGGGQLWRFTHPAMILHETRPGQIASLALPDGSSAVLDTNSAIRVWRGPFGRRSVDLVRGRALFQVAHDASRPFVVSAGGKTVTALGTRFDVYLKPTALDVTLVEGRLLVEEPKPEGAGKGHSVTMGAGRRLIADAKGWSVSTIDSSAHLAWLNRRLVFEESPLGEIVAEFNRYSPQKIAIDPAAAQQRMSGAFGVDDARTFIGAVEALGLGSVSTSAAGYRIASRIK